MSSAPAQAPPIVVQRQHSTRHSQPHSSARTPHAVPRSVADPVAPQGDLDRPVHSSAPRPGHSRQPSASAPMAEHGAHSSHASAADDPLRHHSQRPRKTAITGPSGTWNLGKTIGAGSMGKVKLARKADGSEQVAVKIVPRQMVQERGIDPATGQPYPPRHDDSKEVRTAREAAIVTLLDHPYICGMRDVIKTNNHWYMLCEYVNGGQMLDYIISHGRLKEKQARKFARQIASALDYCHRNSIVHRDLKIENILISKTGDIKIIDFGLSNLFSPRSHLKTFCGSLYFAAPELLQAKQYTGPEVDVWSFGIVLYVLVCGKVPFDDQSMPALHAKIKRGMVDYPQWLSTDCRNLLSRMLVTDPRSRASLQEILHHPWMLKGYAGPPDNCLPAREPLSLPLDPKVVQGMTGFEFGASEAITAQLSKLIESEEYQAAVKQAARDAPLASPNPDKKKGFGFDFYKRRSSTSSKDTLTNPSSEVLTPYTQLDPTNAYSPLISIYYLVREKQERDRRISSPGTQVPLPSPDANKLAARIPIPKQPEAAYTSGTSYEVQGEPKSSGGTTGGRTRPRARTHGDEEVSEAMKKVNLGGTSLPPSPMIPPPQVIKDEPAMKKESTVGGMLRRLSTRRHNTTKGESSKAPPPTMTLQPPDQAPVNLSTPRKSLSVRRPKDSLRPADIPTSSSSRADADLLTPPASADGLPSSKRSSKLGRSTSVTETDWRRKQTRQRHSEDPPGTSGSERSTITRDDSSRDGKNSAQRAKSVGHGRKDHPSVRRSRRDEVTVPSGDLPEEESVDVGTAGESGGDGDGDDNGDGDADSSETPSSDYVKPVFLKGLFSVSTTSTKPPKEIRRDIIRVLQQLGVSYKEIKGGFACVHRPSIDLKSVVDNVPGPEATNMVSSPPAHKRKLSLGGNGGGSGQASGSKSAGRRNRADTRDTSYTNSDVSNESVHDGVLGGSLILQFEIYIVKVPLLALHGIQFKSVNKTNTWQYKSLASRILSELRL